MFRSNRLTTQCHLLVSPMPIAAAHPVHHYQVDSLFGAGDGKPLETKASPSRRRLHSPAQSQALVRINS